MLISLVAAIYGVVFFYLQAFDKSIGGQLFAILLLFVFLFGLVRNLRLAGLLLIFVSIAPSFDPRVSFHVTQIFDLLLGFFLLSGYSQKLRPVARVAFHLFFLWHYLSLTGPFEVPMMINLFQEIQFGKELILVSFKALSILLLAVRTKKSSFWVVAFLLSAAQMILVGDLPNQMIFALILSVSPEWFRSDDEPIVFFDGDCGLCDHSVNTLINIDEVGHLRYAPLQGETAKRFVSDTDRAELSTLIMFSKKKGVSRRFVAIREILLGMGGLATLIGSLFKILPSSIGDRVYDVIAKNRHKLFPMKNLCELLPPELRERILP